MADVYIGLGSNVDHPTGHIRRAFSELGELSSSRMIGESALYKTVPIGPRNQPDYINAVAALKTALPPLVLLRHLLNLERRHHRVRTQKWGPRTLDLDILLYGKVPFRHPHLTIPHPLMHQRNFVLVPLNELNPDLIVPGKGRIKNLLRRIGNQRQGIQLLNGSQHAS